MHQIHIQQCPDYMWYLVTEPNGRTSGSHPQSPPSRENASVPPGTRNHLRQLLSVCCRHDGKRWGGSGLTSDRSNPSRKHIGNSPRSHNAVGWCRSTGGRSPHPWKRGPFRVVPGVRNEVFRRIRPIPGRARSVSTFSLAADRKCGPWCVRGLEPTGRTSGSHAPSRKCLLHTGNHLRQLLPVYCRHAGKHPGRSETTLQNIVEMCLWCDTPSMSCSTANMPHGHNGRDGEAKNCLVRKCRSTLVCLPLRIWLASGQSTSKSLERVYTGPELKSLCRPSLWLAGRDRWAVARVVGKVRQPSLYRIWCVGSGLILAKALT